MPLTEMKSIMRLLALLFTSAGLTLAETRPNIIFILADDWGWGDLGCHGNHRIRTPNIDRLAREGLRLNEFYVTAAVCSPSRASFLTGLFTDRHGIHSHLGPRKANDRRDLLRQLDPKLPLLPRRLKAAGYATAHYGKWHLCSQDDPEAPPPSEYGFDEHRVTIGSGSAMHFLPPEADGFRTWEDARPGPNWDQWRADASRRIFDEAIEFVERHKDQSFFVQTWLYDTHGPLKTNEKQRAPFDRIPLPYQIYYGAAANSDGHIGRLLDKLDELGLSENTIVIFSSDNGPEDIEIHEVTIHGVGDAGPFRGRKRSGYEGGVRMPFIVRWPAKVAANTVDRESVVSAVDLLPTLCSLVSADVPRASEIDGEDLSAALLGRPVTRKRPLFWALVEDVYRRSPPINRCPKHIIRDGPWKLFMHADGSGIELYNIQENALEVDNLAREHPDLVHSLKEKLMARSKRFARGTRKKG